MIDRITVKKKVIRINPPKILIDQLCFLLDRFLGGKVG